MRKMKEFNLKPIDIEISDLITRKVNEVFQWRQDQIEDFLRHHVDKIDTHIQAFYPSEIIRVPGYGCDATYTKQLCALLPKEMFSIHYPPISKSDAMQNYPYIEIYWSLRLI